MKNPLQSFLPFWIFLILFKLAGNIHYEMLAPFGALVLPLWLVGFLVGGASLLQTVLDVPAGHVLDTYGYRRLLIITTIVFTSAGIVMLLPFSALIFIASLLFATLGWVFYAPGVNAYVLSHADRHNSGRFISLRDISGSTGVVLACLILGILYALGTQAVGALVIFLMLLAVVAILLSPKDTRLVHTEEKIHFQKYYIRRHYMPELLRSISRLNPASSMLLLLGFTSAVFYSTVWFVVPLVIAYGIQGGIMSIGLSVFDMAIVLLGFTLGKMADTGNKRRLVFLGLLLFSIAGALLGFNFGWFFLVLGFVATTGDEMASVSLWSWLHTLDTDHANDGIISGVISFFSDLGWAVGPIFAGIAYGFVGPSYTILSGAVALIITLIVYHIMVSGHDHGHDTIDVHKPHRRPHRV